MGNVLQEMEAVGDAIYDLHLWTLESKDEDDDDEEPGGEEAELKKVQGRFF